MPTSRSAAQGPDPSRVELRILGPTEVTGATAGGRKRVESPKQLALLAYLALETADGFRRRDQIVATLWPELTQDAARTQLRKALSVLREALGTAAVVTRGDGEVMLDPVRVWCDAVALERAVQELRWDEALVLYRGELLEGLFPGKVAQEFHDWLGERRKALRTMAATAAWERSRLEEDGGDRKAAAVLARRALDLTPDDEEGVRRLISLLDRHGDRGGALRVYGDWQARLQREYGVEPAPETRKLARRVQAARKGESHETPPTTAIEVSSIGPLIARAAELPRPSQLHARWQPTFAKVALTLVALLGISAFWRAMQADTTPANSIAIVSIRVFGDSTAARFAAALDDELGTTFARDSTLAVRPLTPAPPDSLLDAEQLGGHLRVAYLLQGGLHQRQNGLRLTLRLIRARGGVAVWANSYDVDARLAPEFPRTAAPDIAKAVAVRMRAGQ